jgi:hypothetical protein
VLFFIHLESRRVDVAGVTVHPDERWMQQIARNVTMEGCGALRDCRYLLHDRDSKYTQSFRAIIASGRVEPLVLPARSPNLNAYAERWVRSVKEECLSKVVLFGEHSLRRALVEYVEHYHTERNHQGKSAREKDCASSTRHLILAATIHAHAAPARSSSAATGRRTSHCIKLLAAEIHCPNRRPNSGASLQRPPFFRSFQFFDQTGALRYALNIVHTFPRAF